jgi:hypothetical protein
MNLKCLLTCQKIIILYFLGNDIRSQLVFLETNFAGAKQEINSLQILRDQDTNKVFITIN